MSVSSRNTKAPQRTITNDGKLNLVQTCLDNIVNNIDYWTTYLDPITLNKSKWIITPFDVLPELQRFIPALISRLSKKSKLNERTLGVFLVHNLEHLSITAPFVNDAFIELVCKRCPALRQLDVSGNKNVSNLAARTIAWFCQNITHLNIARTKMAEEGVLLLIHKYQSNLKSLDLSALPITNATVMAIADNCSNLESLNISSCEQIGDEGIAAILAKCHALRSLNASVLWSISDFGLFDLAQCKALTDLDLSSNNVSDEVLAPILQCLPALERLSLSDCKNVALHNVFAALAHCPNLHFLNIGHPPRGTVYHGIHALTGLTELRARSALDEYSLPSLRSLTALHVLDLSLNRAVDDETLTPLTALSSLRTLDLRECEYMTSQGLAAVLQANTQLEVLNIDTCPLIEMPSLITALTALKELRVVNLSQNKTLTVKHINALLASLPLLERIVIQHCSLIPTVQGSKWQELYKHIEWIY